MRPSCFLCLLLLAATGNAQMSYKYWRADVDTGKLYFRMNPAGLIEIYDQNITFGVEYRLNHNWSATIDGGYIFFSQYAGRVKSASGVLFRPGIRKYAGRRNDFFLDLQLHFKEVNYRVKDWLDRNVVDDVATYQEFKTFHYHKRVIGAQFMFGGKEYLLRNHRLCFEVYAGIGVHYKEEGLRNEPNSQYKPREGGIITNSSGESQKRWLPAVPFGLRLVYRFR